MAGSFVSGGYPPDPKVADILDALLAMERGRDRWFWRVIGLVVSMATLASATFTGLTYFNIPSPLLTATFPVRAQAVRYGGASAVEQFSLWLP